VQLPFPLLMSPGWRGLVLRQQHIIPINNMKPHAVAIAWAQIMKCSMYLSLLDSFCLGTPVLYTLLSLFSHRLKVSEQEGLFIGGHGREWGIMTTHKGNGISPLAVKGIMLQQLEREREICSAHGLSLKEAEITWTSLWI
jgi:hypothetical protein